MMKALAKAATALAFAVAVMTGLSGVAAAVDAPKWVAVVHIEAQKAVGLRWAPAAGASGYKVLRSTVAGKDHKEIGSTAQPQHFDKDLELGTTYYYVLQAVAGADVSPLSDERSVAIPGAKKVEVITAPPMDKLTLTESSEFGKTSFRVGVFWAKSPSPSVVAYNLYRTTVPGKDYQMLTSGQDNKYVDVAVEDGKTYYYAVSALDNQFQETPFSAEMSIAVVKTVKVEKKVEKKELQKIVPRPTKALHKLTLKDYPIDLELLANGNLAVAAGMLFLFTDTGSEDAVPKDISDGWDGFGGVGTLLDGNLIVVAYRGLRIYSDDGRVKKEWLAGPEYRESYLSDADQAADGTIYVSDNSHRILKFDEDLKFLGVVNEGDPTFMIANPSHVQIAGDTKYISSGGASGVYILDKNDKVIRLVGEIGAQVGTFGKIQGSTLDGEGNLYVADMQNGNVQVFNKNGDFIYLLTDETLKANLKIALPSGLAVSMDGKKLFVANSLHKTISLFDILPLPQ